MKINAKVEVFNKELIAKVEVLKKEIDANFGVIHEISDGGFERGYDEGYKEGYNEGLSDADAELYASEYEVTPKVTAQQLKTANKLMADDLTVKAIPYFEVSNSAGGTTVTIGDINN